MKGGYVSLEEAHPPIKRMTEMQLASAMLRAIDAALRKGAVSIPMPDSLRAHVLARKTRHTFAGRP